MHSVTRNQFPLSKNLRMDSTQD